MLVLSLRSIQFVLQFLQDSSLLFAVVWIFSILTGLQKQSASKTAMMSFPTLVPSRSTHWCRAESDVGNLGPLTPATGVGLRESPHASEAVCCPAQPLLIQLKLLHKQKIILGKVLLLWMRCAKKELLDRLPFVVRKVTAINFCADLSMLIHSLTPSLLLVSK